jgi:hypothetical protein
VNFNVVFLYSQEWIKYVAKNVSRNGFLLVIVHGNRRYTLSYKNECLS